MESACQNVGVRTGGTEGCFFLEVRATGLEGRFFGVAFLPLEPLLEGDLGLLTGMGCLIGIVVNDKKIIAQMVCFL
jgi:hypothetical protein